MSTADLAVREMAGKADLERVDLLCSQADWCITCSQPERAEKYLRRALQVEGLKVVDKAVRVHHRLAVVFEERNDFEEARKILDELNTIVSASGIPTKAAELLYRESYVAAWYARQHRYKDEGACLERIRGSLSKLRQMKLMIEMRLAELLELEGDFSQSLRLLRGALELAESPIFQKECGAALSVNNISSVNVSLATFFRRRGDEANALSCLRFCKSNRYLHDGFYLSQLAELEHRLGLKQHAEQHFKAALATVDDLPEGDLLAERKRSPVYLSYACWLRDTNRQTEARDYVNKAWRFLRLHGHVRCSFSLVERSGMLRNLKRLQGWYTPSDQEKFQSFINKFTDTELMW